MWYIWFYLLTVTSIIAAATGTKLKEPGTIIEEALVTQMPRTLCTLVIKYTGDYYLQSIAFWDINAQYWSVRPGRENLSKNRFYIIRHVSDGLTAYCIRVAEKESAGARKLHRNTKYHVYQESNSAYTTIAKKCNVPAGNLILYARQVPFLHQLPPFKGWDYDDSLYTVLWAESAKNISKNDQEYVRAKQRSTLFFAPNTTFEDFCIGLKKEYDRCKQIPHGRQTLEIRYSISSYERAYPAYIQAAQNQSPQQGILLKQERKHDDLPFIVDRW